jgi:hypothetical protein
MPLYNHGSFYEWQPFGSRRDFLAALLSAPVFLCRVGVHFYNRPAACGARRGGSAAQRPDSPTAERRTECGWQSIYVDNHYVLSPRLCFETVFKVGGRRSCFEAAVRF